MREQKNAAEATARDIVNDYDIYINCPRCKYIIEQKRKILQKNPNVDIVDLLNICMHCRKKWEQDKKRRECLADSKTYSRFDDTKLVDLDRQRYIRTRLSLAHENTEENEKKNLIIRTHSDSYLNQFCQDETVFPRNLLVGEMFGSDKQIKESVRKSSRASNIRFSKTVKYQKHGTSEVNVAILDSVQTIDTYVDKESFVLSETTPTAKQSHKILTHDQHPEEQYSSKYISSTLKQESQDKIDNNMQRLKLHQRTKSQDEGFIDISELPRASDVPDHKREYMSPENEFITKDDHQDKMKYISKKKVQRKDFTEHYSSHDEPDTQKISQNISKYVKKYSSEDYIETLKFPSIEQSSEDFSYKFPKEIIIKNTALQSRQSSSELIKQTQELINLREEVERKKKEEELRKKIEDQERKRIALEEKKRLASEMQKVLDEERKKRDEERKKRDEESKKLYEDKNKITLETKEQTKIVGKVDKEKENIEETKSVKNLNACSVSVTTKKSEALLNKKEKGIIKEDKDSIKALKEMEKKQNEERLKQEKKDKQKIKDKSEIFKKENEGHLRREKEDYRQMEQEEPLRRQKEEKQREKEVDSVEKHSEKVEKNIKGVKKKPDKVEKIVDREVKRPEKEEKKVEVVEKKLEKREKKGGREIKTPEKEEKESKVIEDKQKSSKPVKEEKKEEKSKTYEEVIDQAENLKKLLAEQAQKKAEELKMQKQQEEEKQKLQAAADKRAKEEAVSKLKSMKEASPETRDESNKPKIDTKKEEPKTKELNINQIKMRKSSADDLIVQLVKIKKSQGGRIRPRRLSELNVSPFVIKAHKGHKNARSSDCVLCLDSELELDLENINSKKDKSAELSDIIIGQKILKYKPPLMDKPEDKQIIPILFQTMVSEDSPPSKRQYNKEDLAVVTEEPTKKSHFMSGSKYVSVH